MNLLFQIESKKSIELSIIGDIIAQKGKWLLHIIENYYDITRAIYTVFPKTEVFTILITQIISYNLLSIHEIG